MATRDLAVKIFGDSTDINRAFSEAGGGAQTMGSRFSGMATKVAAAGVAIGAGIHFAKGFADAAGDLNEAASKSGVIFGDASGQVSSFAEGAASALGLSERAALDFSSGFGALLKSTGQAPGEVAEMSTALTGLAADLGSFNNLATEDVAGKLLAGLGGEAEPLKALGVFINAASVEAKALELGLGDVNGVLTEQEKIQARYALILEQTTDAQGDFARTSDGLANSQKILGAEWENVRAELGEKLAPVFAEVFGWMAETLPKVIDWLGPKLTAASEMFAGFWDEHGESIKTIIAGIGSGIETAWTIAEPILTNIVDAIGGIVTTVTGVIETIDGLIHGDWQKVWDGLGKVVGGLFTTLGNLFQAVPGVMLQLGKDMISALWDGIKEVWSSMWDWLTGKFRDLQNAFSWLPGIDEYNEPFVSGDRSLPRPSSYGSGSSVATENPFGGLVLNLTNPDPGAVAQEVVTAYRTYGAAALTGGYGVP